MNSKIFLNLKEWLEKIGLPENISDYFSIIILVVITFILAYLADYITKKIFLGIIKRFIRKSKTRWDDILYEKKLFHRLAHIAPALVVMAAINLILPEHPKLSEFLKDLVNIYIIYLVLRIVTSFLNGLHDIYLTLPISKDRPIKSYVQVVLIIAYFIGIITILSIVFNKDVSTFLTGLGALAAVLLLVFKDSILGLVGGIQLSANDMVRPGDWVEMPSRGADGSVIEITLNTVKVQNWDKTITTIPTYALVSESFINWRGMEESGGRRIKRSINIDMTSVKFLDQEMIDRYKKYQIIRDYVEEREREIKEYNENQHVDSSVPVNGRRMTNLGTFRRYVEAYLKNHPKIHNEMTFLVRHLQPSEKGIPLEIYVFSNDQVWANFESIQADIFDHILAVIPEFGLRVFQNPSGADFKSLMQG